VTFMAQIFFTKHVTKPDLNFDAMTLNYGMTVVVNTVVLLVGITWYWSFVEPFNRTLFLIGIFGSVFDCLGQTYVSVALSIGPAGPIISLVNLGALLLLIWEAIRTATVPSYLEIIGFVIEVFGALALNFPE